VRGVERVVTTPVTGEDVLIHLLIAGLRVPLGHRPIPAARVAQRSKSQAERHQNCLYDESQASSVLLQTDLQLRHRRRRKCMPHGSRIPRQPR
jgi:hypothetical protein